MSKYDIAVLQAHCIDLLYKHDIIDVLTLWCIVGGKLQAQVFYAINVAPIIIVGCLCCCCTELINLFVHVKTWPQYQVQK